MHGEKIFKESIKIEFLPSFPPLPVKLDYAVVVYYSEDKKWATGNDCNEIDEIARQY